MRWNRYRPEVTAAGLVNRALAILEGSGWIQGEWSNEFGDCPEGAINVAFCEALGLSPVASPSSIPKCRRVRRHDHIRIQAFDAIKVVLVAEQLVAGEFDKISIPGWNDAEMTTYDEVYRVMVRARDELVGS